MANYAQGTFTPRNPQILVPMINTWEEIFMIICAICQIECRTMRSLSKHIRDRHNCNSKEYYDRYLTKEDAVCKVCGTNKVSFLTLTSGYAHTCSHTCGGILHRRNLASDQDRSDAFSEKVSRNQTKIWEDRIDTDGYRNICDKISKTVMSKNALLSLEELKQRYGWMNRLSSDEMQEWKQSVMLNTGAHLWWKCASDEDRKNVYKKRNATRIGVPLDEYTRKIPLSKESYYIIVGLHTAESYFTNKNTIDPHGLRGNGFHLDHKYSIIRGYYDGVPPEIIGSVANLEILPVTENLLKGAKCSISKEILMEEYYAKLQ